MYPNPPPPPPENPYPPPPAGISIPPPPTATTLTLYTYAGTVNVVDVLALPEGKNICSPTGTCNVIVGDVKTTVPEVETVVIFNVNVKVELVVAFEVVDILKEPALLLIVKDPLVALKFAFVEVPLTTDQYNVVPVPTPVVAIE